MCLRGHNGPCFDLYSKSPAPGFPAKVSPRLPLSASPPLALSQSQFGRGPKPRYEICGFHQITNPLTPIRLRGQYADQIGPNEDWSKTESRVALVAEFSYHLRVRFCEVDEYGFVWHGHYLAWFEAARVEMLREVGLTPAHLLELGYLVPVVDVRIACKKPIKSDREITICCTLEPTEKALLTFHFRIVEAASGETCATATTAHVLMDRREKLLYVIPEKIREGLTKLIARYPAQVSTD